MTKDLYALSSYQFELPQELIAQHPVTPRDSSRLMIVNRSSETLSEIVFSELADFLKTEDHLIFNDTKVIPARLIGKREGGGGAEVFLIRQESEAAVWEVLARPGKKMRVGSHIFFSETLSCEVIDLLPDGGRRVRFHCEGDVYQSLLKHGQIPLPPYIRRDGEIHSNAGADAENYQTVYAKHFGAVAAPTAGLHFTEQLLDQLAAKGIAQTHITLHVGLGTFRPVQTEDIREHVMHSERLIITPEAAINLNASSSTGRRICIGTTCCRTLESVAMADGAITPGAFETSIFICPGYQFKYVEALLTNFHLPGSSLLMLVSALAGYELTMEAYAKAIESRFRFFSYGDAMLIL